MSQQVVLVTGGTGHAGNFIIDLLLKEGYKVRTSIRSLAKEQQLRGLYEDVFGKELVDKNLEIFAADLGNDANWEENLQGVDYVLHVASPFPLQQPENPDDLIIPAREGSLRILRLAANVSSIKQVILTSSFASVGYGHDPNRTEPFTEKDWTNVEKDQPPYLLSKVLAEKAAWDYVKEAKPHYHFTVICPCGIFGPAYGKTKQLSTSLELVRLTLNGSFKEVGVPIYRFGVIDVRDLAKIQVQCLNNPKAYNERFLLATGKTFNFLEVAQIIAKAVPKELAENIPTKEMDGPQEPYKSISVQKVKTTFNWEPISSPEESVITSAKSVIALGL
ncbi:hypothetical protein G9P44_003041 [Scheffersomyces stipitis]|nr:hypothetical protein G9P44_003041 [Scheffersomyces stipitis]